MIKFFFTLAWRNIKNNPLHSAISVLGLSIGIGLFILIAVYLNAINNYDTFHKKHERLYILEQKISDPNSGIRYNNYSPAPLPEALASRYPVIESWARLYQTQEKLKVEGKDKVITDFGMYVDSTIEHMYTFHYLAGEPHVALNKPNKIVLNETLTQKIFGDVPYEECLGKTIIISESVPCEITGIIEDLPYNATVFSRCNHFVSMPTIASLKNVRPDRDWEMRTLNTILLKPGTDFNVFNSKISDFLSTNKKEYKHHELFLLPIRDNLLNNPVDTKKKRIVLMISLLALFILILSCINFANLRYAHSLSRIKETALRKVLGAKRFRIILQWVGESTLLTFIAFDISLILTDLFTPIINQFIGAELDIFTAENLKVFLIVFAISLIIGVFSGTIPALKLSKLDPVQSLQNHFQNPRSKSRIRMSLLGFQIGLTVLFISCTILMRMQLQFQKEMDKGFKEEGLLTYKFLGSISDTRLIRQMRTFADQLKTNPEVQNTSLSSSAPFMDHYTYREISHKVGDDLKVRAKVNQADENYFETLGLSLLKGRKLTSKDSRKNVCLINETGVRKLKLENPIGKIIQPGSLQIVGVTKDYNVHDLNWPIGPVVLRPRNDTVAYEKNVLLVRASGNQNGEIKAWTEGQAEKHMPDAQMEFTWLEDQIPYGVVSMISQMVEFISLIAIFISMIGLFGMVSYSTVARSKEIGIRKSLGASARKIFRLLLRSHVKLVILANLVALPLAYLLMKNILQIFACRVNISIFIFIIAAAISLLIMFLTVGYHILKASRTNPVEELRDE